MVFQQIEVRIFTKIKRTGVKFALFQVPKSFSVKIYLCVYRLVVGTMKFSNFPKMKL